jgi:hypothetical protein
MIISASYKTDIPSFYGEWFMNRLRAGYCKMVNPYNRRAITVPLHHDAVDGIVFWTKNVGPFLKHFPEVRRLRFPFILQHTINAYPRALEQAVVDAQRAVQHVRQVAEEFGPRVCVWRYDTIINSSLTPRQFHLDTFSTLASALSGATDEVVISFAHLYRKTLRNMESAAANHGFTWSDPDETWKRSLTAELASIAAGQRMRLTICSQPQFLVPGCGEARCVDALRLADVAGRPFPSSLKGNRKECGCYESRDIGDYDTCPHGCVYCYAVQNHDLAKSRFHQHDPNNEFLFPLPPDAAEADRSPAQLGLFQETRTLADEPPDHNQQP